jgi:hypothetical protein
VLAVFLRKESLEMEIEARRDVYPPWLGRLGEGQMSLLKER